MCPTTSIDLDERIEKCEKILSDNSDSLIFAALSDAYRRKGDLAKAFHVCGRGLKLNPDYGPGHMVMAKINFERGMYCEAERELLLVVQAEGKTRTTELLLAQILIKKSQINEAKRILEKLKVTDPTNQIIQELLQNLLPEMETEKTGYDAMAIEECGYLEKVTNLKDAVGYLKSLQGVMGALVVGDDGLVLESKLNPHLKKELITTITTLISQKVKEDIANIDLGDYLQIMVETSALELWITRFDHQILVLCCSPDAHLGALKIRVSEILEYLSRNNK